jgi:histidinol-phosphatase (PHP family)
MECNEGAIMQIPDYHVHPDYSIDAKGSIRKYAATAVARGLPEICFTTHLDLDPLRATEDRWIRDRGEKRSFHTLEWLDHYWEDINKAQAEVEGQVRLKHGLEIDYFPGFETFVRPARENYPWDFVLVSVHCLEHIAIAGQEESGPYLMNHTPEETAEAYLMAVREAITSGFGQALAHLDYFKRQVSPGFRPRFLAALFPQLPEILQQLQQAGMALEINTRAIRTYGLGEPFPGQEALALAARLGISRITIGSDSHRPEELGNCFDEARQFALEAGFNAVVTYQNGEISGSIPL